MTVRRSSTSFGSRASKARFDRAFLGFLVVYWTLALQGKESDAHYSKHNTSFDHNKGNCFVAIQPDGKMPGPVNWRISPDLLVASLMRRKKTISLTGKNGPNIDSCHTASA